MTLSGGMKRRAMIAKALSHEPEILFLDEPSAGVDVELRRDMWEMVRGLRDDGVTVILTTHYIEEAEEMADRIGVINRGELILVEDKAALMKKLGRKQLTLQLQEKLDRVPEALRGLPLELVIGGAGLVYTFDAADERAQITGLLRRLDEAGVVFKDLHTRQSTLEDIFVDLVSGPNTAYPLRELCPSSGQWWDSSAVIQSWRRIRTGPCSGHTRLTRSSSVALLAKVVRIRSNGRGCVR